MIRELADAMHDYVPHFAVDGVLRTFAFGGYVADSDRRRRRRNRRIPDPDWRIAVAALN